ncbi:M20/M25/M40 family metallo-hydrolase [Lactobacillus sp. UCMA15818]|uniref:M20/M25/M40 family metallo-hydrolase n=1 Tax=Lactobacillaceae TaxID=33958 RepID=UPI0025B20866|nr:M20/M25/M40 family metallo-hydrolase [Lactobacillus sp. UCMA15818]MDN2453999.1 M20/M25/M40 family metallo-hydrolase [Lactobacillus sp. UCMA15818]
MRKFIETHIGYFEDILDKFIRLRSTSGNEDQEAAVFFLDRLLTRLFAAKVKIINTDGAPLIVATVTGKSDTTKLFYGHYDVMPPGNINEWNSEPFTLKKANDRYWGRGTGDNKGQLLAVIFGLYMYKEVHGNFPFNIQLVIEGEEEQGSPHLKDTIVKLASKTLNNVDSAFVVDGSINQFGQHILRLGNRGAFGFEIRAKTALNDNHSGNMGNVMDNAAAKLINILNKIYDFSQERVLIPNFYEGVKEPNQQEENWLAELPYEKEVIEEQTGVKKLPCNAKEYYHKLMFEPTFNISGINAGYSEKGIKTIIPHQAILKIDCRLVGRQNITEIKKGLQQLLKEDLLSEEFVVDYLVEVPTSNTASNAPDIKKICKALKKIDGKALVEPVMPGTVPNYIWTDVLKVPAYTLPLANFDQANHSTNENISQKAFIEGITLVYELIQNLA